MRDAYILFLFYQKLILNKSIRVFNDTNRLILFWFAYKIAG